MLAHLPLCIAVSHNLSVYVKPKTQRYEPNLSWFPDPLLQYNILKEKSPATGCFFHWAKCLNFGLLLLAGSPYGAKSYKLTITRYKIHREKCNLSQVHSWCLPLSSCFLIWYQPVHSPGMLLSYKINNKYHAWFPERLTIYSSCEEQMKVKAK